MESKKRYTIDDLVRLTGLARRTIRFYIQEGLLEPPAGRGRGGFYSDQHLEHLRRIQQLRQQGFKLASIRQILKGGRESPAKEQTVPDRQAWARIAIRPGLEIHVRHDVEIENRGLIQEIVRFARLLIQSKEGDDDRSR